MKTAKTMTGVGIDYLRYGVANSPKKIIISTSVDNKTWTTQGTVDTPQSYNHYFQFFAPQNARYVKVELSERYDSFIAVTEVYIYNAQ